MKYPQAVPDWAPYYQALHDAGLMDREIGELAGVSRVTVNYVRNGTYKGDHQPAYTGAVAVMRKIVEVARDGKLSKKRLKPLGIEL